MAYLSMRRVPLLPSASQLIPVSTIVRCDMTSNSSSQLSNSPPGSPPAGRLPLHKETPLLFRPASPLPYQLQEHCTIYFEEGLCKVIAE